MCGIAGIFNLNGEPVSPIILRHMTDVIGHRGPDGEGFYIDSFLGLGHRRLAILDLSSAGHQPMISPDGQFAIVYNGEVYNFKELRDELAGLGYIFRSRSDTEVVLQSYLEWGKECVHRFNGMFALAIWDKTRQEIFLARDRYGIKPLYYTFLDNTFLFASEQKALLLHPAFRKEIDFEALVEYFTFQNIFTDKTLLKNVSLFPRGSYTSLPLGSTSRRLDFTQYWDYAFRETAQSASEPEYLEELDRLFRQAVKRQLVSDVDVGTYLSGGIDSGAITAVGATQLSYIKTFTCGFDLHSASGLELAFDEREKAELMSYLFKTEHYEMVLKAGDMERIIPILAWHLEEPRVGQSYPNYYVAQLASKFVKVVLSGTGGDELFAGYPWRYYRAAVNDDFEQYVDKYYKFWQRLASKEEIEALFKPSWSKVNHVLTRDIFRNVFNKHEHKLECAEDYINHSLNFEARTFLHSLLIVEDKLSMAHGLETRIPFLDNELVDFAMQVPIRMKLRNLDKVVRLNENEPGPKTTKYFQKTKDGKLILRKVLARYVPQAITHAEKQGFSAPDAHWFKGESIEYVRNTIFHKARIYDFFDRETVHSMVNEHLRGVRNRRLFIWSLLSFEWWLRKYFD